MIISLSKNIGETALQNIEKKLNDFSYKGTLVKTSSENHLVCIGKNPIDLRVFGAMEGVKDIFRVKEDYKLVSRQWKLNHSTITLSNGTQIGNGHFQIMAGPCSIESEAQIESIVAHLVENKIKIMRGGVFKPRTSPYSFRGLGIEGLKLFHAHCKANDIAIITEVMEMSQIEAMYPYVDIFQVGARNSQNYNLLEALGELDKPVLLKRGISGTIEDLLYSAEYIFSKGNDQLMLCERGIRTYETAYRNTFDINAIALLKDKTHLPVIADPSHGIGIRKYVPQIALAASVAGADGVIFEIHPTPEEAKSDAQQTLSFEESAKLIRRLNKIALYS
jgi:3-deoxy-7-phosphoheptulonate synthase